MLFVRNHRPAWASLFCAALVLLHCAVPPVRAEESVSTSTESGAVSAVSTESGGKAQKTVNAPQTAAASADNAPQPAASADGASQSAASADGASREGEPCTLTAAILDEQGRVLERDKMVSGTIGQSLSKLAAQNAPEGYQSSSLSTGCVLPDMRRCTLFVKPLSEAEWERREAAEAVRQGEMTEEAYKEADFWLRIQEDNPRKCKLLFDDWDWGRYQIYATEEEARENIVSVYVPVWKQTGGARPFGTMRVKVHRALALDVMEIFTEIFNDPEHFPVESLGAYNYKGGTSTSEHNNGTAIDINPDANYQIREGVIETGTHWAPGDDPYSIAPAGSVVRAFEAHGWSWGGDAWADSCDDGTGYHDYMHFSYRGR